MHNDSHSMSGGQMQPPTQAPLSHPGAYQGPPKSKMVAGLLGIFLGYLGVHRFYLGYTTLGIIQIVVTVLTCGIGALWGFVEGILYLASSSPSWSTDAKGNRLT